MTFSPKVKMEIVFHAIIAETPLSSDIGTKNRVAVLLVFLQCMFLM
jgi:hypothetical protein